jgi:hypothetical protein
MPAPVASTQRSLFNLPDIALIHSLWFFRHCFGVLFRSESEERLTYNGIVNPPKVYQSFIENVPKCKLKFFSSDA